MESPAQGPSSSSSDHLEGFKFEGLAEALEEDLLGVMGQIQSIQQDCELAVKAERKRSNQMKKGFQAEIRALERSNFEKDQLIDQLMNEQTNLKRQLSETLLKIQGIGEKDGGKKNIGVVPLSKLDEVQVKEESEEPVVVMKRCRGRPMKVVALEVGPSTSSGEGTVQNRSMKKESEGAGSLEKEPKRGRGRPRKYPKKEEAVVKPEVLEEMEVSEPQNFLESGVVVKKEMEEGIRAVVVLERLNYLEAGVVVMQETVT